MHVPSAFLPSGTALSLALILTGREVTDEETEKFSDFPRAAQLRNGSARLKSKP